jgi:hypothetical protein
MYVPFSIPLPINYQQIIPVPTFSISFTSPHSGGRSGLFGLGRALLIYDAAVHNLTDICWKKCVTGSIRSGKLEKGEESCTQNCVERFLDANFTVIKHLDAMRNQS